MKLQTDTAPHYEPLLLVKNISYPNFQLYAMAGEKGQPPDVVLAICILETMKWLRQRFRKFDEPRELRVPDPDEYRHFDLSTLASFHLNRGYKLDVVWLPARRIWTLQLTEPDLGTRPGELNPQRAPVPGRLFETNVSYQTVSGGVNCGFKTIVFEPDSTQAPCEVFRLAFIKHLVRNPEVGLHQGLPLIEVPYRLCDKSSLRNYRKLVLDPGRTLPLVVFAEYDPGQEQLVSAASQEIDLPAFSMYKNQCRSVAIPPANSLTRQPSAPFYPLDTKDLVHYRMGFAHFFILPATMRDAFTSLTGQPIDNGGVVIAEPASVGGGVIVYSYESICQQPRKFFDSLDCFIQEYSKKKQFSRVSCVFVPQAKEMEWEIISEIPMTAERITEQFRQRLEILEDTHREREREFGMTVTRLEKALEKLRQEKDELEIDQCKLRDELFVNKRAIEAESTARESLIHRMDTLRNRPMKPADTVEWVSRWYCDRILIHERAVRMLRELPANEVDLPLLCDALEYLAHEYWDELNGRISVLERDAFCSLYYKRPFAVTPVRGISVGKYHDDYTVTYRSKTNKKPNDRTMDLHLKVGNDSVNLLRIYFFYDKAEKIIVIGSLPKHLPTNSF